MIGSSGLIGTPGILKAGKKDEAVGDSREEKILRRKRMMRDRVNDLSMMERARRGSTEEKGIEEVTVESEIEETEGIGVTEWIGGIGRIGAEATMIDAETVTIEETEGIEEKEGIGEIVKIVGNGNIVENVIVAGVSLKRELKSSSRRNRIR